MTTVKHRGSTIGDIGDLIHEQLTSACRDCTDFNNFSGSLGFPISTANAMHYNLAVDSRSINNTQVKLVQGIRALAKLGILICCSMDLFWCGFRSWVLASVQSISICRLVRVMKKITSSSIRHNVSVTIVHSVSVTLAKVSLPCFHSKNNN